MTFNFPRIQIDVADGYRYQSIKSFYQTRLRRDARLLNRTCSLQVVLGTGQDNCFRLSLAIRRPQMVVSADMTNTRQLQPPAAISHAKI
jgi:hypothetical protein